jgi:Holliday junction resolvase
MTAKKIDNNQKEIVAYLRSIGASVQHLHTVGHGCPDILVGYCGKNYLLEIKNGSKSKLTEDEERFFREWKGDVQIIRSIEDIVDYFSLD